MTTRSASATFRESARVRGAVVFAFVVGCRSFTLKDEPAVHGPGPLVFAAQDRFDTQDPQERLAATNPLGFLKRCRERYRETVSDYRCHFHKRERRGGRLTAEEEMIVRFREHPYSVDMRWVKNAGIAKRVRYVAGRWRDGGRELLIVEPSGLLGLLFPGGIKRDIHGPLARRAARRTIDQFGFQKTLDQIIRYCELAEGDPAYDLEYVGRGTFDGRATYVFERRLPAADAGSPYPDRLLVIHIDREWLVPTACLSYADDLKETLLGSYMTTSVEFNIGLTDEDF